MSRSSRKTSRRFVGVRHGVAVSNGTVALHLALVALGIGPGDEVIVPDLTFAATINAVLYCGATPVIVDVDAQTWCMSLARSQRACTPRTKAIIPVHLYGRPAEIGPIADFAAAAASPWSRTAPKRTAPATPAGRSGSSATSPASRSTPTRSSRPAKAACASPTRDELATSLRVLRDHGMSPGPPLLARAGRLQLPPDQPAGGDRPRPAGARFRDAAAQPRHRRGSTATALNGIPGVRFPPDMDEFATRRVARLACRCRPNDATPCIGSRVTRQDRDCGRSSIRCRPCRPTASMRGTAPTASNSPPPA